MINFANPHYLYCLLIIPLIALFYVLGGVVRRNRLKRFGRHIDEDILMPDASKYLPGVKIVLALVALTFIIIAVARPYVHTDSDVVLTTGQEDETISGIEVMICVDVSNSMLASATEDVNGVSRLQRAKFILDKALNNMKNDRVGLIVFAGDAYLQLPLTADTYSAKMLINNLTPEMVPLQGTAIGAAIDAAMNSFDPESQFNKAIIILTDGENFEDDAVKAAKKAAEANIQVDVIGLGTVGEGMPIPTNNDHTAFYTYDGEEVRTALDAEGAAQIAEAGNGIYISGGSNSAVSDLDVQLRKIEAKEYKRTSIPSDSTDLFPIATLIALILLLIDVFLPYRKLRWLRNIRFFSRK